MPLIVNSPYSGRPVKIRDQDVGRAIRDEEGRIFYAVPRSDGQGWYGAPTRHGSPKDEQRYLDMQTKGEHARQVGAAASAAQVHDAMGRRRGGLRRLIVLLILLALLAAGVYVAWRYFGDDLVESAPFDLPTSPTTPQTVPVPDDPPQLPAPAPPQPQALRNATIHYAVHRTAAADPPTADAPTRVAPSRPAPPAADAAADAADADTATDFTAVAEPRYTSAGSGVRYRVLEPGDGAVARTGSYVLIHYTARLTPGGPVMDSSRPTRPAPAAAIAAGDAADPGDAANVADSPATATADPNAESRPIGFVLGAGRVIRGWDIGIVGMTVGETRELIVPAHLITQQAPQAATSGAGAADGLDLVFEIELIDVLPGVRHEVVRPGRGDGAIARVGDLVEVRYAGWLVGQTEPFDDARSRPRPLRFRLGEGEVIRGWDLGIAGMREGEIRTLVIPPHLAYGRRGIAGLIPPGAALRYDIELLAIIR